MAETEKRVLIFGDSNSWGWIAKPEIFPTQRLGKAQRWPGIMASILGEGWEIYCDALPGRTTDLDDPMSELGPEVANGLRTLPASIAAQTPLDLVVIALGTNDFKEPFKRSVNGIAEAIMGLGKSAAGNTGVATTYAPPKVLILCPPPLGPLHPEEWAREVFSKNSQDKSKSLAATLAPMVASEGFFFFDAGRVISTEGVDGVHFSEDNHAVLGRAMAKLLPEILKEVCPN